MLDVLSKVWCWGYNYYGQVGSGDNTNYNTPNQVSLENDAVKVALGYTHSCAIDILSKIWCWGSNGMGQLGIGNYEDKNTPTEIVGLSSGASDISLGGYHSCMVDKLFKLFCWGDNRNGQLGIGAGSASNEITPT